MKVGEVKATREGWVIEVHRLDDRILLQTKNANEPHRLGASLEVPLQWECMNLAELLMRARPA